ncbi:hypothetical protein GCM10027347_44120 [Larkinella harenae]
MIRSFVWKTVLTLALITAFKQTAWAQREVLYSQYLTNPLTINPAYTGSRESLTMTAIFRRKWLALRGPGFGVTQSFGADGAVGGGKVGIGLQALNDRMGLYSSTGFYGSLSYRITLPSMAKLSFGASGGINVLPIYDPATASSFNRAMPSVGAGVYYEAERFWAGVSMPELVTRPIALGSRQNLPVRYQRPLFINFGGRFDAGESIDFLPSILLTHQTGLPLGIDLNAKIWIEEKLGLGVSYRANNSSLISTLNYFVLLAEYELSNSIRVGYTFNSNQVENPFYFQKGVHELVFRYTPSPIKFQYK